MEHSIVTKTGDKGTTGILGKERVWKDSAQIQLIGDLDEVSSGIGYLRSTLNDDPEIDYTNDTMENLKDIQNNIYWISTEVSSQYKIKANVSLDSIESAIKFLEKVLPDLKHFISFSGHRSATWAFHVRAITRRAERAFVSYRMSLSPDSMHLIFPKSYEYINRLSDYLFLLGRYLNYIHFCDEEELKRGD